MTTQLSIQVVAFETDFGGVVSNTRYVEYLERGRYALLHAAGLNITQMWSEHGLQPVVRAVNIEYLAFARHEEKLVLQITSGECRGAQLQLHFELQRENGEIVLRATQTLVFVNTRWKPVRVPHWFSEVLE